MLEKTIKSVLNKKVNDWLESIDDEDIIKAIKKDLIITGGCFTSMLQNEKPKDYDVYFRTKETTLKVANYYVNKWNETHKDFTNKLGKKTKAYVLTGDMFSINEKGVATVIDSKLADALDGRTEFVANKLGEEVTDKTYTGMTRMIANLTSDRIKVYISSDGVASEVDMEGVELGSDPVDIFDKADEMEIEDKEDKPKYRPVFLSTNAITLSNEIQIVVRFYGEPEQIHSTYDFEHTKAYWCSYENQVVIPKEVYETIMNKTLVYTGSKYPLCSIVRMRKFIKRGWNINAGQILKMCMQLSDLDLTNIDVLEDQLIGVDSLYFTMLITQFRKSQEENSSWTYTSGYVMSIIDKIF